MSDAAAATPVPALDAPVPSETLEAQPQRKKRQKIAVACDLCRLRKVKCDGARPVCAGCAKKDRGQTCTYSEDNQKVKYVGQWQTINPMPDGTQPPQQQAVVVVDSPTDPANALLQLGRQAVESNGNALGAQSYAPAPPLTRTPINDEHQESPQSGTVTSPHVQRQTAVGDAMGTGVSSAGGGIGDAFFGSSSASSFMKQMKDAVDSKVPHANRAQSQNGAEAASIFALPSVFDETSKSMDAFEYILPPRRGADELVGVYWELVHPLYPLLDKHRMEQAYKAIYAGKSTGMDERLLMCTFNVIFALSCQLLKTIVPGQRQALSNTYFKRAQELLQLNLWGPGSPELVRCLLLMGQYLQSTNTHNQCWMAVGHAVRIAQSLGLHLPEDSARKESAYEREMSRRIWHSCVLMDRVLSMTFGRPAMISKSVAQAVPLPAMIDDSFLSSSSNHAFGYMQKDTPMSMAFFVKSLEIYEIVNDILISLYSSTDASNDALAAFFTGSNSSVDVVFQYDRALMSWGRTLPPHLRISTYEWASNPLFKRQATICRSRFLHTRILLFRPILTRFCLPEAVDGETSTGTVLDESLAQRTVVQCSSLCLRSAHDLIDLFYMNLTKDGTMGSLPAWWYCVFCKFSDLPLHESDGLICSHRSLYSNHCPASGPIASSD